MGPRRKGAQYMQRTYGSQALADGHLRAPGRRSGPAGGPHGVRSGSPDIDFFQNNELAAPGHSIYMWAVRGGPKPASAPVPGPRSPTPDPGALLPSRPMKRIFIL